ncbi:MAG: hypothetical protein NVSMB42_16820 [Herpetosiphon sp.]
MEWGMSLTIRPTLFIFVAQKGVRDRLHTSSGEVNDILTVTPNTASSPTTGTAPHWSAAPNWDRIRVIRAWLTPLSLKPIRDAER